MLLELAESYIHRLDPFAIQLTENFGLRWYGLSYVVGFIIAWLIIRWFTKTARSPLKPNQTGDLMFAIIVGVLVGGRLGYVVFYQRGLPLIEFCSQFPYWELLAINRGGMASHGGMIGVILACWWFGHRRKVSPFHLFDLFSFTCGFGLCLGRLANFVNAELWGKPLPASLLSDPPWWSVKYPQEIYHMPGERLDAIRQQLQPIVGGDATFAENVIAAVQNGQQQVIDVLRPLLTAYYPSQIFQAITDGPLLVGFLALLWLKPRKPGVVCSWFLIWYGVLRIISEVFRQPDEGVALLWGLSRGQVFSILMVAVGLFSLWLTRRRKVDPVGGLLNFGNKELTKSVSKS